jgi:NAD-dependent dihydropyrimidine dehydrogenase PreA subunit
MPCYIPREYMYLDILHVFYTYPKRVQDTFWDTHQIHQDTCILGASLVSHWIHVRIHQDTCILDSSSRYIRIHRDTKLRYMYLERVMTTLQDTIRIHHDTCILDASPEPRWIHTRYMRDTLRIHLGYVSCILDSFYLPCCPRSSRRSASSSLESGSTCGAR